ncbi:MAG: hypothetical protein LBM62_07585 [Mediterranea sp.]|jgi:hypothetical protein|nr:hypothetical protein [Mediterranea sp.]
MRLFLVIWISGWFSVLAAHAGNEYRSLVSYSDGFAGVNPTRVDRLSLSGEVLQSASFPPSVELTCLASDASALAVGGKRGILYVCTDTTWSFRPLETGIRQDIRALTVYKGVLIAAAGSDLLLLDDNGVLGGIRLPVKGTVVALSAGTDVCYGVTDAGEIIRTDDGTRWTALDFNTHYRDYYPSCRFTGVCTTDHNVAVAGVTHDGKPVVYLSMQGEVWYIRDLICSDAQGAKTEPAQHPTLIVYDFTRDTFLLGFTGGIIMSLPTCSHCNECFDMQTRADITGIAVNNGRLMTATSGVVR